MNRFSTTLLFSVLTLVSSTAGAQHVCPVISAAEVAEAFQADSATLLAGNVSGLCTWAIEDGGILNVQTHKRPTPKETRQMFDTFEKTTTARLGRTLSKPKLGQRALVVMNAAGSARSEAAILALDEETLIAISYYPDSGEASESDDLRVSLEQVGKIVLGNKAAADQTFGQCELLEKRDIERLLGKGKKTIHRLGPLQCIASVQPGGGSLVVMSATDFEESKLKSLYDSVENGCTQVPLPELGPYAFATYACEAPGDAALAVNMLRNGIYFSIVYAPSNRNTDAADLDALRPVAQRIYQMH